MFLGGIAALCERYGLLLILDEVQCGMGRTGTMFCYESYGITPDIVTTAKALGGGLPFGAFVAKEEVAASFGPGAHGSTFGGNPVAAAASAAVFRTIEEKELLLSNRRIGNYFYCRLNDLKNEFPQYITAVRGVGLLLGMEVTCTASKFVNACLERGLLLLTAGPDVVRFLPPYSISEKDVDFVIEMLKNVLKTL